MTDFVYGKDFTYSDGKITWLKAEEETTTTNEPASYTVSYENKTPISYSVTGNKTSETNTFTTEPDTYSVKITTGSKGSYTANNTKGAITTPYDDIVINIDSIKQLYAEATNGQELPIETGTLGSQTRTYIDPDSAYLEQFTIKANGDTYQYGRDFIIIKESSSYQVVWGKYQNNGNLINSPVVNAYKTNKGITDPASIPSTGTSYDFSYAYDNEETFSGKVNKTDNDKRLETVFGEKIDPTYYDKLEIYGYDFDTDYKVNDDGEIEWLPQTSTSNADDDYKVDDDDNEVLFNVTKFNEDYEKATGSELATITLTGSDGVIRTYLDPEDRSFFNLTTEDDAGNEIKYEYGRDYVIRVNDDGQGYALSWFAAADRTGDSIIDANDANIAVATYAQEKNISTLNFKTAPEAGESYTFSFSGESKETFSSNVTASDEDKDLSLTALLGDGLSLTEDDYDDIVIKDSDGNTYKYVATEDELTDNTFTIINDEIVWYTQTTGGTSGDTPNAPDANTEYTISYESLASIQASGTMGDDSEIKLLNDEGKITDTSGSTYLSYEQILKDANSKLTVDSSQSDVDEALKDYFSITDEFGDTYTYGTDFRIVIGDEDGDSEQHKAVLEWISEGNSPAINFDFTISYTGRGEGGEVVKIDDAITRSNSDAVFSSTSCAPVYSEFQSGTTTITQGSKTFFEGYDFEVAKDDDGGVLINWKTGTDWEWYYPTSGQYTINLTTEDGETKTYSGYRDTQDTLDLRNFGFTTVSNNGHINSLTYNKTSYNLDSSATNDDGKTAAELVKETLGINLSESTNNGVQVFNFDWTTPARTTREGLPGYGDEIEVEYEYNTNTFTLSDDGDGLVDLLGLNSDVTEAQNAILVLDGEEIEKDLNNIGESYGNELIKGMTINLKGVGEVSMDVSHDAEKAVTSIQTFVDNYNSLMSWMNTRMTESAVDEDTAATIDSDDFRMRWGLLHGNSLLRNTKSQMRDTVAQNFTFSFTSRTSSEEIYGAMSYNGLKNDSTLRLRINSTYVDVPILTTDTLQDIVDKINDKDNPAMKNIFYGDDGQLLGDPLIKAKIEGDKLVISSSSNTEITMSGSAAMNALKMNYTYKGVYQLGIATTSDDYGKSGELEFDTDKFMEALEDNPDEVQNLMLKFASSMDTWTKSMLNSSASGATSGTLTRQIEDIDTQISSIDEYLEKYQDRLDRMEESLRTKYAAAEQQISKLSQQASAISAILQQLTSSGSSNSSSS